MRAADVVEGIVVNVIEVDSLPAPPEWKDWGLYMGELVECGDHVAIDWRYVDGHFLPPEREPEPAPEPLR